jgi:hypothetical protein
VGASLVAMLFFSAPAAAQLGQPRIGCDPVSWDAPVAAAPARQLVCGDGRIGTFDTCVQHCAGGCPGVEGCSAPVCATGREICDGAALGGASCRSLGFGGGTLACDERCQGYDVRGCSVCLASDRVQCTSVAVPEAVTGVRLVASGERVLAIASSAGGIRWAIAGRDLALAAWSPLVPASAFDAIAQEGGFLLATLSGTTASVSRVDAAGRHSPIAELPDAAEVLLWSIRGGGAILTTGTAFGSPFRAIDARGAIAPAIAMPAHATREDGARMLVLDAAGLGALVDRRSATMHLEWDARPGDFVIAFAREAASGVQVVRDGEVLTGMGYGGLADLEVHLGAVPAASGRASDPLWRGAVPDEATQPGSGTIRVSRTTRGFRDAFEPHAGRAFAVTGTPPTAPRPRRLFAEHPSVGAVHVFRGEGRAILAATIRTDPDGGSRIEIARTR